LSVREPHLGNKLELIARKRTGANPVLTSPKRALSKRFSVPDGVATDPFPPFGHNVGHNAVGVGFIPFRSPKVGAGARMCLAGW
jgi:hypothetical protein